MLKTGVAGKGKPFESLSFLTLIAAPKLISLARSSTVIARLPFAKFRFAWLTFNKLILLDVFKFIRLAIALSKPNAICCVFAFDKIKPSVPKLAEANRSANIGEVVNPI